MSPLVMKPNQEALKLDFIVGEGDDTLRKRRACAMCAKAHLGCDGKRPCARCISKGYPHLCKENEADKKISTSTKPRRKKLKKNEDGGEKEEILDEKNEDTEKTVSETVSDISPRLSTYYIPAPSSFSEAVSSTPTIHQQQQQPEKHKIPKETPTPFQFQPLSHSQQSQSQHKFPHPFSSPSTPPRSKPVGGGGSNKIDFLLQPDSPPSSNQDPIEQQFLEIQREVKKIRNELKETQKQQLDMLKQLSNIQELVQMLFVMCQPGQPPPMHSEPATVVWDCKTQRLVSNNLLFENLLSCSREELQNYTIWNIFPEIFRPIAENFYWNFVDNAQKDKISSTQIMPIENSKEGIKYVQVHCVPQFDKEDQLESVIMHIKF